MGQKTVRFSDLSGELITRDDSLARIVIHEHPELGDSPVEIEALADEAAAIEKGALRVAVVDLYLPGEEEPRRVAMEAAAFDELATHTAHERAAAHRPARPPGPARQGSRGGRAAGGQTTTRWSTPASRTRAGSPRPSGSWSGIIWTPSTSGSSRRGCGPSTRTTPSTSRGTA